MYWLVSCRLSSISVWGSARTLFICAFIDAVAQKVLLSKILHASLSVQCYFEIVGGRIEGVGCEIDITDLLRGVRCLLFRRFSFVEIHTKSADFLLLKCSVVDIASALADDPLIKFVSSRSVTQLLLRYRLMSLIRLGWLIISLETHVTGLIDRAI